MAIVQRKIRLWTYCWICPRHKHRLPKYDPKKEWWSKGFIPIEDSDKAAWRATGRCWETQTYRRDPTCPCLATPRQVKSKRDYYVNVPLLLAEDKKVWPKFREKFQERFNLDGQKSIQKRVDVIAQFRAGMMILPNLENLCLSYLFTGQLDAFIFEFTADHVYWAED